MIRITDNTKNTPLQQLEKQRIGWLDALKCLGILLVIEGHVWSFGMGIETYDTLSGLMSYPYSRIVC